MPFLRGNMSSVENKKKYSAPAQLNMGKHVPRNKTNQNIPANVVCPCRGQDRPRLPGRDLPPSRSRLLRGGRSAEVVGMGANWTRVRQLTDLHGLIERNFKHFPACLLQKRNIFYKTIGGEILDSRQIFHKRFLFFWLRLANWFRNSQMDSQFAVFGFVALSQNLDSSPSLLSLPSGWSWRRRRRPWTGQMTTGSPRCTSPPWRDTFPLSGEWHIFCQIFKICFSKTLIVKRLMLDINTRARQKSTHPFQQKKIKIKSGLPLPVPFKSVRQMAYAESAFLWKHFY